MTVMYELLPQEDRRAAEKRAKRLLRSTPAAQKREFFGTLRDALDTAYKKPKNVVAVLVYEDGHDTWCSDVIFRKGKHKLQYGITCCSEQQAFSCFALMTQIPYDRWFRSEYRRTFEETWPKAETHFKEKTQEIKAACT